jgi:putative membrane protein
VTVDVTTPATNTSQPGEAQQQDGTVEPDYRFTLANERTFLAWQRTSLGLLAAAVAAVQFMPELPIHGMRHMLGAMVGILAMLTAGTGLQRWVQVDRAIRHGQPLPRPTTPVYLAVGLVMIALVTVAVTVATTAHG